MSETRFKPGDRVIVSKFTEEMPGYNYEMERIKRDKKILIITEITNWNDVTVYKMKNCQWVWRDSWLELDGPPLSKEEQLLKKIKQLWEKQDFVKNHLTIG